VLTLGGRLLDEAAALKIVDRWLNTEFSGDGRHVRRLEKISEIEHDENHSGTTAK
jgi:ribose 5-phosphate isomerase B